MFWSSLGRSWDNFRGFPAEEHTDDCPDELCPFNIRSGHPWAGWFLTLVLLFFTCRLSANFKASFPPSELPCTQSFPGPPDWFFFFLKFLRICFHVCMTKPYLAKPLFLLIQLQDLFLLGMVKAFIAYTWSSLNPVSSVVFWVSFSHT